MGMDVYGDAPSSKVGEYFRNNVWWWRPLADYVLAIAPEETVNCEHWQTNDGDGLNEDDSLLLAEALQKEIDSGRTAKYEASYNRANDGAPDEPCDICGGTGKRLPVPETGAGKEPCNACGSTGKVRPLSTNYPFSTENVQEFVNFLKECGGFKIC